MQEGRIEGTKADRYAGCKKGKKRGKCKGLEGRETGESERK
jgi:hypothetical protein